MANNNEQFKAFHDAIKACKTRKETLRTNRQALRDRIKKYFKDNHSDYIQPKFCWQGSFAMDTILNPIKDESGLGAYDLDDGLLPPRTFLNGTILSLSCLLRHRF